MSPTGVEELESFEFGGLRSWFVSGSAVAYRGSNLCNFGGSLRMAMNYLYTLARIVIIFEIYLVLFD